jgi:hypothetical protein
MRFAVLAFFLLCGVVAVRLAAAGYSFDVDSAAPVERAAHSVDCAEYAVRLAAMDPERAPDALDSAIHWNPRSSAAHIARGLEKERAGDFDGAARDLLLAAGLDRQYLPAWTLANFYFRRAGREQFEKWARRSGELIPGDVEPLLVLCDRMDAPNTLAMLPEERKFQSAYFDFLIRENRFHDAHDIAKRLVARHDREDVRRLTGFATHLIDAGQNAAAISLWRELFPGASWPVNGDLRTPPSGEGFDWRLPPAEGVTSDWSTGRLRFWLTGREPESCILFDQPEPLETGRYTLRVEYASDIRGIRWMLDSAETAELDPADRPITVDRSFSAGHRSVAWLRLIYRRDPAVQKAEGKIEIRSVRWEPQGPQ